ncbi:MAG TPA: recombinase RecT, partial [Leptospiraceae bacterium]|nr:recombinase RecT [Leptospiraceae bacterium]
RDGLLAHAHRQPDFVKMDGDVVWSNDGFETSMINGERSIVHTVKNPAERGHIIGAWAMVERRDHGITYFYAPLGEYKRNTPIWNSHPSAMILKVAESYALRKAYSISGVVGEAEVEASNPATNITAIPGTARDLHPDWGDDPVLAQDLKATTAFDCISGAMSARVLQALPSRSQIIVYGSMSGEDATAKSKDIVFFRKNVTGFHLASHIKERGTLWVLKTARQVQKLVERKIFHTEFSARLTLAQAPEGIAAYAENMTSGKPVILPRGV